MYIKEATGVNETAFDVATVGPIADMLIIDNDEHDILICNRRQLQGETPYNQACLKQCSSG